MIRNPSDSRPPDLAESVRNALIHARNEAVRLRHPYVAPEHLLLGLLQADDPETVQLFERMAVERHDLARAVTSALRPWPAGNGSLDPNDLPYTAVGKRAIEQMKKEADKSGQTTAWPEHLFLSLVADERTIVSKVCRQLGITPERIRSAAATLATGRERAALVQVDDSSDRSIYEQIVAQVQEKIATGTLLPGERLPPVRRLADQLDIAPGTVARAYSELERLGVVVTEGARGTRVAERNQSPDRPRHPPEELVYLLRPVAVTAFHLGATADHLRASLEEAMKDIFEDGSQTRS